MSSEMAGEKQLKRSQGSKALECGTLLRPGWARSEGYLGPATVLEVNETERMLLVEWAKGGESCRSWARAALAAAKLKPGDVALVISQDLEDFYAIGILSGALS